MGYNPTRQQLVANIELLEALEQAADEGQELVLEVAPESNAHREQYRLRRLLIAADNFQQFEAGRFVGLGARLRVTADPVWQKLIIKPKGGMGVRPKRLTMLSAVDAIRDFKGSFLTVRFYPEPGDTPEAFEAVIKDLGFVVGKWSSERDQLIAMCERVERDISRVDSAIASPSKPVGPPPATPMRLPRHSEGFERFAELLKDFQPGGEP